MTGGADNRCSHAVRCGYISVESLQLHLGGENGSNGVDVASRPRL